MALTHLVFRYETDRQRSATERRLAEISFQIASRVERVTAVLEVSRSYMETRSGGPLSRERFMQFHRHLQQSGLLDGMLGLGFAALIEPGARAAAEARLSRDYGVPRTFWPEPEPGRQQTAILMLEPANARNLAALGYDMFSEEVRRSAMEAAMLSRRPQLSGPVTLVQEITDDRQTGLLAYIHTRSESLGGSSGFLYAPLRLRSLFESVLHGDHEGYDLRIMDSSARDLPLYQTRDFGLSDTSGIQVVREIEAAGRRWELHLRDSRLRGFAQSLPMTFVVGVLAIVSALLAAAATHSLQAYLRNEQELSRVTKRLLAQKDLHLREMSHRLKNVLARVIAIGRQTAVHSPDRQEFLRSFNSRLQAMSAAQDLLTRAAPEGTSLRSLLRSELQQLYGDSPSNFLTDGPEVFLSSEETEALGLCLHEMATNALKYGAGAQPGGQIRVTWTLEGRRLHLTWSEETEAPLRPVEGTGFGTRLMESCVKGTLGGTLSREFHTHGLKIEIIFDIQ